jgi:hypothetical protein
MYFTCSITATVKSMVMRFVSGNLLMQFCMENLVGKIV